MPQYRHKSAPPHYVRFALALAGLTGTACATSPSMPDSVAVDATVADDCQVSPPPEPLASWGDGACYYLDGGGRTICPQGCPSSTADGSVIVGPLSPPDLPVYS